MACLGLEGSNPEEAFLGGLLSDFYSGAFKLSSPHISMVIMLFLGCTADQSSIFLEKNRGPLVKSAEPESSVANGKYSSDSKKNGADMEPIEEITSGAPIEEPPANNGPVIAIPPRDPGTGNCPVDWNNVVKAQDFACFQSVEAVFANLPDKVRPYWVLVHDSESNQRRID